MAAMILPFSEELRPRLPTIVGNVDHLTLHRRLTDIDAILRQSGFEKDFIAACLEAWLKKSPRAPSARVQTRYQKGFRQALRCNTTSCAPSSRRTSWASAASWLATPFTSGFIIG
jgi:hypothetical protein